ncbi:hypothetical protein L2E82_41712 [Cichorium intybus]|uniref:Uncharacterized protein n=1 Tax=Cichorium intybus TaxID=13427 RepID=A0ACB8ZKQ1_CICIN|nr:hypothetical protein L2E82_41712 [Cichorium intybus]
MPSSYLCSDLARRLYKSDFLKGLIRSFSLLTDYRVPKGLITKILTAHPRSDLCKISFSWNRKNGYWRNNYKLDLYEICNRKADMNFI